MAFARTVILTVFFAIVNANVINNDVGNNSDSIIDRSKVDNSAEAFKGVYTECFLYLSYSCLQKKTLLYLKALNNLTEVSVIGDYVKFVKINTTEIDQNIIEEPDITGNTEGLSLDIDNAVNNFFDTHVLRFKALGKDIAMSQPVDEFVGRKKRKGGGGGGGGHDDGKKKMMMMAMMCMKMKMMMMIPAMMGMMGMMSFKGMMFSMMTFMMSKMMLLMKILEKKGGAGGGGGGGGGGGDGWAAGGGGGGAWMPAGGQDYGGGGGGYDANGQWQSRSIMETAEQPINEPIISYVTPLVRYNNNPNGRKPYVTIKNLNDEVIKANVKREKRDTDNMHNKDIEDNEEVKNFDPLTNYATAIKSNNNANPRKPYLLFNINDEIVDENYENLREKKFANVLASKPKEIKDPSATYITPLIRYSSNGKPFLIRRNLNKEVIKDNAKSRTKRGIIDVLQNTYLYWMNQVLGSRYNNKLKYPKYRIVNGVKYVYYPLRYIQKAKKPKALNDVKAEETKTIITAEDFNKGEIVEGPVESRMHKKKLMKMKDSVNDTVEDNPWE